MTTINGWLEVSTVSGSGTTQITLTAPDYTDIVQRSASLRIEGANGSVVYLTAAQEQYDPPFKVNPPSLDFAWTGGTLTLQVTSDVGWKTSYPDWITLKPRISVDDVTTVQVSATANPGDAIRSGAIVFMNVDNTPIGTVSITQAMNNVEGDTIIYTTTDGNTIENPEIDNLIGNYYYEGHGYLVFDGAAKEIPASAFYGYTTLETITFVDGTSLGDSALKNCTALKSVNFSAVTAIANSICSGCTQLQGDIDLSNIVDIGAYAFQICESITSVTIGSACANIQDWAFYGCKKLESITSEAITAPPINGRTTFKGIKRGGTLVNPAESDYSSWFAPNNYNLGYYGWNAPEFSPSELDFSTQSSQTLTLYTKGSSGWTLSLPDWITADPATGNPWSSYTVTLTAKKVYLDKSDVIDINDDHYKNGAWGTRIGVTTVASTDYPVPDSYHIYYLPTDNEVIAPNNLSYVSNEIGEDGLGVITLDEPLSQLPSDFFREKSTLKGIAFPSSLYIIGDNALYGCDNLTDIQFGGGEIAIGFDGIGGCDHLTGYTLPQTIVSIGPCGLGGMYPTVSTAGAELIEFGPDLAELWNASLCGLGNVKRMNFYGMTPPVLHYGQNVNPPYDTFGVFDYINPECVIHTPSGSDYSIFYTYGLPESVSIIPDLQAKEPSSYSVVTVKTQGATSFDGSTNQSIEGYFDATYGAVIHKNTAPFKSNKWLVYVPSVDGETGLEITGGGSFSKSTTQIGKSNWFSVSIVPSNFNTGTTISEEVTFANANESGDTVSFNFEQKGGAGEISVSEYYPSSASCKGVYFQTTNRPGNYRVTSNTIAKKYNDDGTIRLTQEEVYDDGRVYCSITRTNVRSQQILEARFRDTFGNHICVGFTLGEYGVDK